MRVLSALLAAMIACARQSQAVRGTGPDLSSPYILDVLFGGKGSEGNEILVAACAALLMEQDKNDGEQWETWYNLYNQSCRLWSDIERTWYDALSFDPDSVKLLNQPGTFDGKRFESWYQFAYHFHIKEVLGGKRFDDGYLLGSPIAVGESGRIDVKQLSTDATFFGNYPPPDDLDGQVIDDAATYNGADVEISDSAFARCVKSSLDSVDQVHARQLEWSDKTTAAILGPRVLSDHMPTFFDIKLGDSFILSGMELNMLAKTNIPNGYYNAKPCKNPYLWSYVLRIVEPWQSKLTDLANKNWKEGLQAGEFGNLEKRVWPLRKEVGKIAFNEESSANEFVGDAKRQTALGKVLKDCSSSGSTLPDIIFFVEYAEQEDGIRALTDLGYELAAFEARRNGRSWVVDVEDGAFVFVQKHLLVEAGAPILPLSKTGRAIHTDLPTLEHVSKMNRGKPLAGAKLKLQRDGVVKEGIFFSLHAEKRKTEDVIKGIVEEVSKCKGEAAKHCCEGCAGGNQSTLPLVIAGDFNGVLTPREAS